MIVSFVVFDVPGTIGMPSRIFVLSSQIYSLVADSPRGIPEYGKVSAMALMFTLGLRGSPWPTTGSCGTPAAS
jgi:hypothetical protein